MERSDALASINEDAAEVVSVEHDQVHETARFAK